MKSVARIACILLVATCVVAQRGHRDPTPDDRDSITDKQLPVQQIDSAQLRRDADELARLASTLPADIARTANGALPKDLKDKLKRIEKLSKRLRTELQLN